MPFSWLPLTCWMQDRHQKGERAAAAGRRAAPYSVQKTAAGSFKFQQAASAVALFPVDILMIGRSTSAFIT